MFTLVKHPDNWLTRAQRHQFRCLKEVPSQPGETKTLPRDAIAGEDTLNWALVRPVEGLLGVAVEGNRLIAVETGDCWLGHLGNTLHWFQEGAVTLEIWRWSDVPEAFIPSLISGFHDSLLELLHHNVQLPQDPAPGFEFFRSGQAIINEGEAADCVYTLIQGRAKVIRDGVQLGIAREGEILGLQAMLLHTTRTATVVAEGNCSAVRVEYDKFQNLITSRPELVVSTLETMAKQIERMNQRLLQMQDKPNDTTDS